MQNMNDVILCPVIAWAKNLKRILKYSGTNTNTYVNNFFSGEKIRKININNLLKALRAAATSHIEVSLGFKPE